MEIQCLFCSSILNFQTDQKTCSQDQSWQWANGPVIKSNVYGGEVYNAQKEISRVEFRSRSKSRMAFLSFPPGSIHLLLVAQSRPPIKKMKELPAKNVTQPEPGTYIFDFGQNFAGWTRIKVNAPAGTTITIRTAEEMDKRRQIEHCEYRSDCHKG